MKAHTLFRVTDNLLDGDGGEVAILRREEFVALSLNAIKSTATKTKRNAAIGIAPGVAHEMSSRWRASPFPRAALEERQHGKGRPGHDSRRPAAPIYTRSCRGCNVGSGPEPGPDVIRDGPEPGISDPLAVEAGHRRRLVSHDVIDGRLVFHLVGHGAEGVPERVEPEPLPPVDVQPPQELGGFLADRARRGVLRPALAVLGDEHQRGVGL